MKSVAAAVLSVLGLAALTACAANPERIPDHRLYSDDGGAIQVDGPLTFVVVGNLRPSVPVLERALKLRHHAGVSEAMIEELRKRVDRQEVQFVTLMGDSVTSSGNKQWGGFDARWREVLDGETLPTTEGYRVPAMPVVGDLEYVGDNDLMGMEGAFPGFGTDIGFNRVASWYDFDVRVEGEIWRFVVMDSNKAKLGSRWNEQLYWIPRAAEGRYDHVVAFMHHPLVTLGQSAGANVDNAPMELLDTLEDNLKLFRLRGVFSGAAHTTEVFLPNGKLGTAYLGAGGGGGAAENLERWGNAREQGMGDIQLEPMFDLGLQGRFDKAAEAGAFPENVIEMAKGSGSWAEFTAAYDAGYYPIYGFWQVTISGEALSATFNQWQPDGTFLEAYTLNYAADKGWIPG